MHRYHYDDGALLLWLIGWTIDYHQPLLTSCPHRVSGRLESGRIWRLLFFSFQGKYLHLGELEEDSKPLPPHSLFISVILTIAGRRDTGNEALYSIRLISFWLSLSMSAARSIEFSDMKLVMYEQQNSLILQQEWQHVGFVVQWALIPIIKAQIPNIQLPESNPKELWSLDESRSYMMPLGCVFRRYVWLNRSSRGFRLCGIPSLLTSVPWQSSFLLKINWTFQDLDF